MMAKRTTAVSLKRWCVHQGALRNLIKRAFTCQRPQLYTNQVLHLSMQRRLRLSRDKNADRDIISALYSRRYHLYSLINDHLLTHNRIHCRVLLLAQLFVLLLVCFQGNNSHDNCRWDQVPISSN